MSKYITDKLIEERLKKRGFSSYDGYGAEDEDADYKKLCKHYDLEIIEQWHQRADYFMSVSYPHLTLPTNKKV